MSRLSVIVPCRNGAAFLAPTLRAALNQTRPPDEIVLVDDGSTDDSRAIAESFGSPVRVLSGPAEGAAVARNTGAAAATGDLLMFLDADDLLTPPTLAALETALAGHGRAVALCPWDRYELEGKTWLARPPSIPPARSGHDLLAGWLMGRFSPPCCVLWGRDAFEAAGGWSQDAGLDDDGNLMRRALARGIAVKLAPGGLALYRRLPGEMRSYSARLRETFGLQSRLVSLTDTVDELDRAGRLQAYRAPLAEAISALAADARGHEIAPRVAALAARSGGATPRSALRRNLEAVAARLSARRAEWRIRPITAPSSPIPAALRPLEGVLAMTGPLVSVIIPTFNRAALVVRAARSVLGQSWRNLELIVVDDGSRDGTAERLDALDDPRLRVIRQQNGGVARARNRGLEAAQGDWIAFLDSDDVWRPEKLARQMALMRGAPSRVGFCHTGLEITLPGETAIHVATATGRIFEPCLLDNPVRAPTSCGLVRREAIEAVGGFDPDLPAIEDWDWLQRIARLYDVAAIPEPLVVYRDEGEERRSKAFRPNMTAREMLWRRNRHALRRAGLAHLYLIESARRELREREGCPRKGRSLVLAALAEKPAHGRHLMWLPYMLAPFSLRAGLRRLEAIRDGHRRDRTSTFHQQ